jgi:hypothetical protein
LKSGLWAARQLLADWAVQAQGAPVKELA